MGIGTRFPLLLLTLVSGLGAQDGLSPPVPLTANAQPSLWRCDPGESPSLQTQNDDGVLGIGRNYKVRFDRSGFAFTPALGERAPRNFPLRLQLEAVGRGSARTVVEAVRPEIDGVTAVYRRGPCVERCALRSETMKHDIVFEKLPPGAGDLVATLRVTTELAAIAGKDGGLDFLFADCGGVRIGSVIGRDALGREVAGTMQLDGDRLELRLPSTFVDEAALPLTIDPLVSLAQLPTLVASDERRPDAAYGSSNYLVAYEIVHSATDRDIYGVIVTSALGGQGSLLPLATTSRYEGFPSVAYIETGFRWVVVWEDSSLDDIRGCAVVAIGQAFIGAQFSIASGTDDHSQPDVGGNSTGADDNGIVVWNNNTLNAIYAAQIEVTSGGTVTVSSRTPIRSSSTQNLSSPKISKTGGDTGRYCIVYREDSTANPSRFTVSGVKAGFYDLALNPLAARHLTVAATGVRDDDEPSVDGDGNLWTVAWESEASSGSGANEVRAYTVGANGNGNPYLFATRRTVVSAPSRDNLRTDVGYAGETVLIAYHQRDTGSANSDLAVHSVSLVDCKDCEGPYDVATSTTSGEYNLRVAGHPRGDDALLVYESRAGLTGTSPGDIYGRLFEFDGGRTSEGVPGCGSGGRAVASCPRFDNPDFEVALQDGAPLRMTFLVLSPAVMRPGTRSCGPCELQPDPMIGWLFARTTNSAGKAEVAIPVPPGAGSQYLYAQWATLASSPTCNTFQTDFSSGINIAIH